jgi:hypothetical protein
MLWRLTISDDMLCSDASPDPAEVTVLPPPLCVCAWELIPTPGIDRRTSLGIGCCTVPNFWTLWRPNISDNVLCSNASSDPPEGTVLSPRLFVCAGEMIPTTGVALSDFIVMEPTANGPIPGLGWYVIPLKVLARVLGPEVKTPGGLYYISLAGLMALPVIGLTVGREDTIAWLPQDLTCSEDWLTRPGVELVGLLAWTTIAAVGVLACVVAPLLMQLLILSRLVVHRKTSTSKPRRSLPSSDRTTPVQLSLGLEQRRRTPKSYRPGPDRERNQRQVRARPRSSTSRSGTYGHPRPLASRSTDAGGMGRRKPQHPSLSTVRWAPDLLLPGQRGGFVPCDSSLRELQQALEGEKGRHEWRRRGLRPPAIRVVLRDAIRPRERAMIWVRPDLGTSATLVWRRPRGRRQVRAPLGVDLRISWRAGQAVSRKQYTIDSGQERVRSAVATGTSVGTPADQVSPHTMPTPSPQLVVAPPPLRPLAARGQH